MRPSPHGSSSSARRSRTPGFRASNRVPKVLHRDTGIQTRNPGGAPRGGGGGAGRDRSRWSVPERAAGTPAEQPGRGRTASRLPRFRDTFRDFKALRAVNALVSRNASAAIGPGASKSSNFHPAPGFAMRPRDRGFVILFSRPLPPNNWVEGSGKQNQRRRNQEEGGRVEMGMDGESEMEMRGVGKRYRE